MLRILLFSVMKKVSINEFYEIISDPITLGIKEQFVVQHADLPEVNNEFSVTLRLKLKSHSSDWATVFHKGKASYTSYVLQGFWAVRLFALILPSSLVEVV